MTDPTPRHPQLAVSAAIFRDGEILLVRRARSPARGVYTLPGGRVEFGEDLHTAVAREVTEETGLSIAIIGLAGWREILPASQGGKGGDGHYVILPFAARWQAGEPTLNDELDDAQWRHPDALDGLTLTDGLPDIIAAARRLL
ncbi:putative Nudix hydrolase family protein; putative ADP-ribose pyrophosphatase [Bradyrhizobium sp. ORS 278]|uniref:NUDIX hydrolase n=1 Tax=Bradyrhizobium sp. (strain ORS 278) TaxID=114615 RepID=UPI0001507817|nr:NUDIX hydrolase [Bradyrhizobium sp. ORS 278]CAL75909.1 putative Nudix hydrolase family protein; putative ADP-ribose pyrophosphatase [Bradyrhizobium sp. ORS 278]